MNISVRVQDADGDGSTLYHFQLYSNSLENGLEGQSPRGHVKAYIAYDVCDVCHKAKPDVHRIVDSISEGFFDICIECEDETDDHGMEPPGERR